MQQQQRGLSEDWRQTAGKALDDTWNEMRQSDWEERARILAEKRRAADRRRREEEDYKEMERQQRREERQRREEGWERHLRWKSKQLQLEEQRKLQAEQQRKAEELRQKEAEQRSKDEELRRKEEEQQRKDEELRRKDEELKRKDKELRKKDKQLRKRKDEQPRINQEHASERQDMQPVNERGTVQQIQSIADVDKSPGSPSSSRSRIQPSSTDSPSVRSPSSPVGITVQLHKPPGQPEKPSSTSSEAEIQERPRRSYSRSPGPPSYSLGIRPSGRHAPHVSSDSEVLHSESPKDPTGRQRVSFTAGGRKYRTQAPEWHRVETQNEESGCRCSIM